MVQLSNGLVGQFDAGIMENSLGSDVRIFEYKIIYLGSPGGSHGKH